MPSRTLVVNFIGDSTQLDKVVKTSTAHLSSFEDSINRVAKSAFALGGAYLGLGAAKTAINNTQALGETVLKLHGAFGLSIRDATAWGAQIQARGSDSKQLMTSFKTLSTQVVAAAGGSKTAQQAFADLGISQKDLLKHGNNLEWVIGKVSDGLAKMPAGTLRGADASKLLGRTYQTLIPLLAGGSVEMQKQLGLAAKFGVTFTGGAKGIEALRQKQIELSLANIGLQTTFTEQIAPTLLTFGTDIIKVINDLRPYKTEVEGLAGAVAAAWTVNKVGKGIFGIENAFSKILMPAFKYVGGASVEAAATVDASMATAATSVAGSDAAIVVANDTAAGSFSTLSARASGLLGVLSKIARLGTITVTVAVIFEAIQEALKILHSPMHMSSSESALVGGSARGTMSHSQAQRLVTMGSKNEAGPSVSSTDPPWVIMGMSKALYEKRFGHSAFMNGHDGATTTSPAPRHDGAVTQASIPLNPRVVQAATLAVQTARITDQTKVASDAAQARAQTLTDLQTLASQQLQGAAQALSDSAGVIQARFTAAAQKIDAAATVGHDQTQILVQGMQDATQIQTDRIAERGLYGAQLITQKLQVQLDVVKAGFDRQTATQQKVVDQLKAAWDGKIAAAQTRVAMVTQHQDHLSSLAQQRATQIQLRADTVLANATTGTDLVQLSTDMKTALAQQAVTLAAGGPKSRQAAAAAALKFAQAQGSQRNAAAAFGLGNVTASTTLAETVANSQSQKTQDTAAYRIGIANLGLARTQGAAQLAESRANAKLGRLQDKASIIEQRLQDQIAIAKTGPVTPRRIHPLSINFDPGHHHKPTRERARGGLNIQHLVVNGPNLTGGELAQQFYLKVRPHLTAAG